MASLVNINDTTIATDIISAFASHQMVLKQLSRIDLHHLCNNLSVRIRVCSCVYKYIHRWCVCVCQRTTLGTTLLVPSVLLFGFVFRCDFSLT